MQSPVADTLREPRGVHNENLYLDPVLALREQLMPKTTDNSQKTDTEGLGDLDPTALSALIEEQLDEVAGGGYSQFMGHHFKDGA